MTASDGVYIDVQQLRRHLHKMFGDIRRDMGPPPLVFKVGRLTVTWRRGKKTSYTTVSHRNVLYGMGLDKRVANQETENS